MSELPEMIGKYKIVSLVAKGGMGAVYKAIHPTLRRHVIIKKLTIRGNASVIERFKREAQILLDLNDPRIVHLFDYFKEGNSHYLVLEYVDGMSLDVLIKKRRYLSGELSLLVFLDACRALKYAHDKGIIHRDIKPGNILISRTGEVKLADFGIASVEDEEDSGLTKEGMTLGTPSYMPPEQFENSKHVDKRADIYAMGVMLYEMVTGKKPFPGNFAPDTIMMIQKGRFAPAKKINPDIPPIVTRLIRKMIRPNPRNRFQDMGPVIRIIEKYLKRFPVEAMRKCLVDCLTVANHVEPAFKPRKKKRVVFSVVLVLLALAGAGSYAAWNGGYVHRYLLADTYGAVKISVRLPLVLKTADDLFLKAALFVNDRKDFPAATAVPIVFANRNDPADQFSYNFVSNTLFVKPGAYRLKLYVENRIYWYSFTVDSLRSMQSQRLTEKTLAIGFDAVPSRPISVRTEAFDALTGRNITDATNYLVQVNGDWLDLSDVPSDRLRTGTVWKFRTDNPAYYPEFFSLKIAPYQDELFLHGNLVPLPGNLRIKAPDLRMKLTLNGSETVVQGGEDMRTVSLAGYRGGNKSWSLPSGRYEVAVEAGKNIARVTVVVAPNATIDLSITTVGGALHIEKE